MPREAAHLNEGAREHRMSLHEGHFADEPINGTQKWKSEPPINQCTALLLTALTCRVDIQACRSRKVSAVLYQCFGISDMDITTTHYIHTTNEILHDTPEHPTRP
jgi:hypothetical protein